MNKDDFLRELKTRLAVLEPSEQQDILEEYAQHIDMRVEGGLTEEEAIRDFGDLDQLVALLYEAYHVNPDFQASPPPPICEEAPTASAGSRPEERFREGAGKAGQAVGSFFKKLGSGFASAGHKTAAFFHRLWMRITGLFHRQPKAPADPTAFKAVKQERTQILPSVKKTAGTAGRNFLRLCKACLRLGWNLLLLLCALPFAGLALAGLVALGILMVLLIQGYPVMGPALICVGGMLCCGALLCLGWGFILRKGVRSDDEKH